MDAAFFVDDARVRACAMIERESRGPGDLEAAMRRIARKFDGIAYADLWTLRYRPPKEIAAQTWAAIVVADDAHRAACAAAYADARRGFAPQSVLARLALRLGDAALGEMDRGGAQGVLKDAI